MKNIKFHIVKLGVIKYAYIKLKNIERQYLLLNKIKYDRVG